MIEIAPSILSSSFASLKEVIAELETGGADLIHFDVMDGQFVPPITFGDKLIADLRESSKLPFEAHLMTLTPNLHAKAFIDAGCETFIFHTEVTAHAHRFAQEVRNLGAKVGVAINPGTPAEMVYPLLKDIDMVLVMTVNPGWGGQKLIEPCLEKVASIRERCDLPIEVDGGIDMNTIRAAYEAGATRFVVGSFLAKAPDKQKTIAELRAQCSG